MPRIEDHAPTGARYVDGEERHGYIDRPMRLVAVTHEPNAKFGPRWVVTAAMLDTGEEIAIGLAANGYRDRQLGGVQRVLQDGEGFDPVCLFIDPNVDGHPWAFRTAEADEIAAATTALPAEVPAEPDEIAEPKARRK